MAARPVRPPRVARFLVGAIVRDPIREYLLGDLEEQFFRTAAPHARHGASTGIRRSASCSRRARCAAGWACGDAGEGIEERERC